MRRLMRPRRTKGTKDRRHQTKNCRRLPEAAKNSGSGGKCGEFRQRRSPEAAEKAGGSGELPEAAKNSGKCGGKCGGNAEAPKNSGKCGGREFRQMRRQRIQAYAEAAENCRRIAGEGRRQRRIAGELPEAAENCRRQRRIAGGSGGKCGEGRRQMRRIAGELPEANAENCRRIAGEMQNKQGTK